MNTNSTIGRIVLSSFFFLYYMGMATWMAFLNLYLENIGYSGTEIGFLGAAYQGAIFLSTPVMGFLSDKYGIKKVLLSIITIAIVLILFYDSITLFLMLLLFTLLLASVTQPIGALIDSIAINFVRISNRSSFGRFRLWGSIGWAISTYFTGFFIARLGISIIFPLAAFVFVFLFISIMIYPINETNSSRTKISREHLRLLLKNKTVVIFSFLLLLYGIALAPLNMFINLYFLDIGATYDLVGKAFAIQGITEIPFFILGIHFVKKYGARKSIIISMAVTLFRIFLYVTITTPELSIWIGLGQGFTFSLFLVAVVEFFHDLIPENLRATGQSIIWAFHFGAGVTIGNIIIGYLYDLTGMVRVMQITGIAVLLVMVLFLIYFKQMEKRINN